MKRLFELAIEYQELLKQLPPDVAYSPSYRQQRREFIRKKFNMDDSHNYQQKREEMIAGTKKRSRKDIG